MPGKILMNVFGAFLAICAFYGTNVFGADVITKIIEEKNLELARYEKITLPEKHMDLAAKHSELFAILFSEEILPLSNYVELIDSELNDLDKVLDGEKSFIKNFKKIDKQSDVLPKKLHSLTKEHIEVLKKFPGFFTKLFSDKILTFREFLSVDLFNETVKNNILNGDMFFFEGCYSDDFNWTVEYLLKTILWPDPGFDQPHIFGLQPKEKKDLLLDIFLSRPSYKGLYLSMSLNTKRIFTNLFLKDEDIKIKQKKIEMFLFAEQELEKKGPEYKERVRYFQEDLLVDQPGFDFFSKEFIQLLLLDDASKWQSVVKTFIKNGKADLRSDQEKWGRIFDYFLKEKFFTLDEIMQLPQSMLEAISQQPQSIGSSEDLPMVLNPVVKKALENFRPNFATFTKISVKNWQIILDPQKDYARKMLADKKLSLTLLSTLEPYLLQAFNEVPVRALGEHKDDVIRIFLIFMSTCLDRNKISRGFDRVYSWYQKLFMCILEGSPGQQKNELMLGEDQFLTAVNAFEINFAPMKQSIAKMQDDAAQKTSFNEYNEIVNNKIPRAKMACGRIIQTFLQMIFGASDIFQQKAWDLAEVFADVLKNDYKMELVDLKAYPTVRKKVQSNDYNLTKILRLDSYKVGIIESLGDESYEFFAMAYETKKELEERLKGYKTEEEISVIAEKQQKTLQVLEVLENYHFEQLKDNPFLFELVRLEKISLETLAKNDLSKLLSIKDTVEKNKDLLEQARKESEPGKWIYHPTLKDMVKEIIRVINNGAKSSSSVTIADTTAFTDTSTVAAMYKAYHEHFGAIKERFLSFLEDLKKKYPYGEEKETVEEIAKKDLSLLKIHSALRLFDRVFNPPVEKKGKNENDRYNDYSTYVMPIRGNNVQYNCSIEDLILIFFASLNNDKVASLKNASASDVRAFGFSSFINAAYKAHRGYNLNEDGKDDLLEDKPICSDGAWKQFYLGLCNFAEDVNGEVISETGLRSEVNTQYTDYLANHWLFYYFFSNDGSFFESKDLFDDIKGIVEAIKDGDNPGKVVALVKAIEDKNSKIMEETVMKLSREKYAKQLDYLDYVYSLRGADTKGGSVGYHQISYEKIDEIYRQVFGYPNFAGDVKDKLVAFFLSDDLDENMEKLKTLIGRIKVLHIEANLAKAQRENLNLRGIEDLISIFEDIAKQKSYQGLPLMSAGNVYDFKLADEALKDSGLKGFNLEYQRKRINNSRLLSRLPFTEDEVDSFVEDCAKVLGVNKNLNDILSLLKDLKVIYSYKNDSSEDWFDCLISFAETKVKFHRNSNNKIEGVISSNLMETLKEADAFIEMSSKVNATLLEEICLKKQEFIRENLGKNIAKRIEYMKEASRFQSGGMEEVSIKDSDVDFFVTKPLSLREKLDFGGLRLLDKADKEMLETFFNQVYSF